MKSLLFTLLLISTTHAHEYSVIDQQGFFYLIKAEKKICEIISVGGMPKFIKLEKIPDNQNIVLLKYFAGTAGTYDLIDVYRACIYDKSKQRALADIPYKYDSDNDKIMQPELLISPDLIKVYDPENDQRFNIKLSN